MVKVSKKKKQMKIPKHSYWKGFPDEGISSVLHKTPGFRYSEKFLHDWYTEP